jgi:integrase
LKWEHVDLAAKMLEFIPQKVRRKKRTLKVPIHPKLYAHLNALASSEGAQKSPFLCPSLAGREVGGRAGLSAEFMGFMDKAGVDPKRTAEREGAGHGFSKKSFHSLRYFFVSGLANKGVAADVRRKLAGHADERMTARYSKLEDRTLRAAVAKLPGGKK